MSKPWLRAAIWCDKSELDLDFDKNKCGKPNTGDDKALGIEIGDGILENASSIAGRPNI
jgi:hypothetical protein